MKKYKFCYITFFVLIFVLQSCATKPPENPSKLAQAINELLSDKVKADTLAANGNIFVKNNMTWDIIFPKYIQFYENLLND